MQKILVTEPLHEAGIRELEREFQVDVRLGMGAGSRRSNRY